MSLRRLHYFVTVAEQRSFTAAAHALRMSQPPLSTQIRDLERELGVELFRRHRNGVSLTAAGRVLLPEALQLLERYALIVKIAQRASSGEAGRLALGIVPSAANGRLPALLRTFRSRFPDVAVTLTEGRPPELQHQLDVGQIDMAVRYARADDAALSSTAISQEQLVLALPLGHPLAHKDRVSVRALHGQPLVLPTRHGGADLYDYITRLLNKHEVAPDVVQGDIWMVQTIVGLVASGIGIAIVPQSAAVVRPSEVIFRPIIEATQPVPLYAIWRTDTETPTARRFLEICSAQPTCTAQTTGGSG